MTLREDYFRLLDHLGTAVPVCELADAPDARDIVALRHDVDHDLDVALEMAFWESRRGVRSTYYLLNSTAYWSDPQFTVKCQQLADLGHEVGLHVNALANWYAGRAVDVESDLRGALAQLRAGGVEIRGVSAHGDPLCYSGQFANHWCFSELKPHSPQTTQRGITAEGTAAIDAEFTIDYPTEERIQREDGQVFWPWSISMAELGLDYDAMHLPQDEYFTDSGGGWMRSRDPMDVDLSRGRYQVLVHPISWRGLPRIYFFLSTARSGSTWTSRVLDAATSFDATHEFTLNHRVDDGQVIPDKRTSDELDALEADPYEVSEMIRETRRLTDGKASDYAECNVYLERFLPQLKAVFPEATLIHLRRDSASVVRSILERGWYATDDEHRHPRIDVAGWDAMGQLERACWYVRNARERLDEACDFALDLESITKDATQCAENLARIGMPAYPRLIEPLIGERINVNASSNVAPVEHWAQCDREVFERICATAQPANDDSTAAPSAASRDPGAVGGFAPPPSHYGEPVQLLSLDITSARMSPERIAKLRRVLTGSRSPGRSWREFIRSRWVRLDSAERSQRLVACATRASLRHDNSGLLLEVDPSPQRAHLVLGGGTWTELPARAGWPASTGCEYRGQVQVAWLDGPPITLYCIGFDGDGRQVHRQSLGRLQARREHRRFAFRIPTDVSRFCLAIHAPAADTARQLLIKQIELAERRPSHDEHSRPAGGERGDSGHRAVAKLGHRLVTAVGQFRRYSRFLQRLLRDAVLRYPVASLVNYGLTSVGLAMVGMGFVFIVRYFRDVSESGVMVLDPTPFTLDGSPLGLILVACIAAITFGAGALLQYWGRKRTFGLMGEYERFCAIRTLQYTSKLRFPFTEGGDPDVEVPSIVKFVGRDPRICSRMVLIVSNLIRDSVIFLFALSVLFYIDAMLAVFVFLTLVAALPYFYKANMFAIHQTEKFDRVAGQGRIDKIHLLRDLLDRPTPLPDETPTLQRLLRTGPMGEMVEAFAGRRLALERATLAATLVGGVLFFEIVLVMGGRLVEDGTAWTSFVGFIVALQFFVMSLMNAARSFTSIARFYPLIRPYYAFVEEMEKRLATGKRPPAPPSDDGSLAFAIPRLDGDDEPLVLARGSMIEVLSGVEFNRELQSALLNAALGASPSSSKPLPWWTQLPLDHSDYSCREYFGLPVEMGWPDCRAILQEAGFPETLPDGADLDLDAPPPAGDRALAPATSAALGAIAARKGDAGIWFVSGDLWGQLSESCRRWIAHWCRSSRLAVTFHIDRDTASSATTSTVVLCAGNAPVGWCQRSYVLDNPSVLEGLRSTEERATALAGDIFDDEDL